jgi:hypothetical protein
MVSLRSATEATIGHLEIAIIAKRIYIYIYTCTQCFIDTNPTKIFTVNSLVTYFVNFVYINI